MYFLYIWFLLPCCIRAFAYVHKIRFDFRAFSSATLGGRSDDDNFFTTFSKCVNSEDFRFSVWQKLPKLYNLSAKKEKLLFGIEDLQHSLEFEFFDAGRGCCDYERSGWSMRTVSKPTGTAFEDANLKFSDIQSALQVPNGTVIVNSAGAYIPKLASYCLSAVEILQLPVAINLYVTAQGQSTSAPLHTDKQDVFVIQTEGCKRWKVYAPPEPRKMPRADPFARGKGNDLLHIAELRDATQQAVALFDAVLEPGHVLYVPAGFPHTTDTLARPSEGSLGAASVHLTLGVDTHIWGLTYAHLRSMVLKRSGVKDNLVPLAKLSADKYWSLQNALPLGFLGCQTDQKNSDNSATSQNQIVEGLLRRMQAAEPTRWGSSCRKRSNSSSSSSGADAETDTRLVQELCLNELAQYIVQHHLRITELFADMYRDVALKITPARRDLSVFRSQPYMKRMEETMADLAKLCSTPTQRVANLQAKH